MKFDPTQWNEVSNGKELEIPKGRLWLRSSGPVNVYVKSDGVEVLAGFGQDIDITLYCKPAATFRVDAPKGVRSWLFHPIRRVVDHETAEIYTNVDREIHESGSMNEVTRALRMMRLEHLAERNAMREQMQALRAPSAPVEPELEPEPEPESEPKPEPASE